MIAHRSPRPRCLPSFAATQFNNTCFFNPFPSPFFLLFLKSRSEYKPPPPRLTSCHRFPSFATTQSNNTRFLNPFVSPSPPHLGSRTQKQTSAPPSPASPRPAVSPALPPSSPQPSPLPQPVPLYRRAETGPPVPARSAALRPPAFPKPRRRPRLPRHLELAGNSLAAPGPGCR